MRIFTFSKHSSLISSFTVLVALCILLVGACRKPDLEPAKALTIAEASGSPPLPPTVVTISVAGVENDNIPVSGRVDRQGSSYVNSVGICFGSETIQSDTVLFLIDNFTVSEIFIVRIPAALVPPGTYVRAFAKNETGTGRGEALMVGGVVVTTNAVDSISDVSAIVHGTVFGVGAAGRGICYSSTITPPTIADGNVPGGTGSGNFSAQLVDLTSGELYSVRAYAYDLSGNTVYGETLSFRPRLCPDSIQDASGNWYDVVQIGGRCWMAENLKTANCLESDFILLSDGQGGTIMSSTTTNTIPFMAGPPNGGWSTDHTVKRCNFGWQPVPQNSYGHLYNWYAVNDPRKVCPTGWEVPSRSDWQQLVDSSGGMSQAGAALKASPPAWNGTMNSGFLALPAGALNSPLGFTNPGDLASWWTSTSLPNGLDSAYSFGLYTNFNSVQESVNAKWHGRSVRCIQH